MWSDGLSDEMRFWREWFTTKGSEWPDDYAMRIDPQTPLQPHLVEHLAPLGQTVRLLDVGAGPLTYVGKQWPGHDLHITAVDALAERYDQLMDEFHIDPPVRTEQCDTELLTDRFGTGSFDAAHALNTLDHSYDPLQAIRQMIAVVRPGGLVILRHYANEAENESYQGLHQWNFDSTDGVHMLWRPDQRWNLGYELTRDGSTVSGSKVDNVVEIVIRKH